MQYLKTKRRRKAAIVERACASARAKFIGASGGASLELVVGETVGFMLRMMARDRHKAMRKPKCEYWG